MGEESMKSQGYWLEKVVMELLWIIDHVQNRVNLM